MRDAGDRREELLLDGTVTVAGAVKEFGLSRSVLYELMAEGRLPYCQPHSRRLIPRAALRKLLAETMVGAVEVTGN